VLSALKGTLIQALMPPKVRYSLSLLEMSNGYRVTQLISVGAKLGIADLLKDGPRHNNELAKLLGADDRSLYRLLRALASLGIFSEVKPNYFALTPCGELLQTDIPGSMRAVAIMNGEEWHWRSWGNFLDSVKTGESVFEPTFGCSFYQYLAQNAEAKEVFDAAMTNFSELENSPLLAGYDFSSVRSLVDVGGGQGKFITSILKANPTMKGILFDLPNVIHDAEKYVAAEGLAERCQTVPGDFMESIPSGGDTYMLKSTIHMFDDEQAVKILKNCYSAMPSDGKLLLIEMVIPPGNEPFIGKILDLQMLVQVGGRERTEGEYQTLLEAAGFKLTRIFPTRSPISFIEGVRVSS
jgi:hypothetical protein